MCSPTAIISRCSPKWSTRPPRSAVSLASTRETTVAAELLRATQAARQLGLPTKELLRLVHDREIRFVMVKGIAHIPFDAIEEYRAKAS